jgi:hypothetical protein
MLRSTHINAGIIGFQVTDLPQLVNPPLAFQHREPYQAHSRNMGQGHSIQSG